MAEALQIRPRHASLPTVPETQMSLPQALEGDETPHSLDKPRLTWSVDLGDELRAMTTFDLWYALNTGDLPPEIRVWRLGREAWSAAREVPELACALRDGDVVLSLDSEIERSTLDYSMRLPSFGEELIVPARESTPPEDTAPRDSGSFEIVLPAALRVDEPFMPAELVAALVEAPMPSVPTLEVIVERPSSAAERVRTVDELPSVTPPSSYVREIEPTLDPIVTPARQRALARWRVGLAAAAAAVLLVIAARVTPGAAPEGALASDAGELGVAAGAEVVVTGAEVVAAPAEPLALVDDAAGDGLDPDACAATGELEATTDPVAALAATAPLAKATARSTKRTTLRAPKSTKLGGPARTTKPVGQKRQHRTGRAS